MIEVIDNRSEEVQEILSRTPTWMLRWGLTVLLGFILILLTISYFIQYPDVISSNITITSENPPISLIAHASGKIDTLLIVDKEKVKAGEILAVIENPANYLDVQNLKIILDSLKPLANKFDTTQTALLDIHLPNYQLGAMQAAYDELVRTVSEYRLFLLLNGYPQKINSVARERAALENYFEKCKSQNSLLAEDLELGKLKYIMDSTLFAGSSISKLEYNESKSVYLQKRYGFQSAQTSLSQTAMQMSVLEKEEMELNLDYQNEKAKHQIEFQKANVELFNQITTWELQFVLRSPIDGVAIIFNLSKHQPVNLGDQLFIISPDHIGTIIGRIKLPIYGSAKVKEGQQVNVKLLNYPHEEYGELSAKVRDISILPSDSLYLVNVIFPEGLITNSKKHLEFKQEMQGPCEIITENRSIFDRLLGKLSSILPK